MMNLKKIGKEFYKKNIIKFSILIIIIILIIFIRTYIGYIKSILFEDAYMLVKTTSVKESSYISNLFNIRKEILKSILISNSDIISDSDFDKEDKEDIVDILKSEAALRGFKRIGIADLDGNAVTTDGKKYSIKDRWDFKEIMSGKCSVYYKSRDKIDNSIVIISTIPIVNNGTVKGVLFATDSIENLINLSYIENYFGRVSTYVVDTKGDILVKNNESMFLVNENIFNKLSGQNSIEITNDIIDNMDHGEDGIKIVNYKNEKYYLGYSKVENSMDLYVVVSLCRDAVLANSNKILISSIVLVIAIMIVTISAFILIIKFNEEYAQLQEANSAKRIFLANISHEIRTPLYGIMGLTSAVINSSENNDVKMKEYLGKIDVLSNHLLSLLNDVIDISKIEAREIRIEKQKVEINNILSDINIIIKDKINEKNQNYKIITEGIDGLTIIGDELKLKQIILNLLINAIKYTSNEGTISLIIKLISKDLDGNVKIMFKVSDNGIGMSEEFMDKMFLPFAQEDNSNSREFGGSGLGLSICKEFIEAMGGELIVKSRLGYGSVFTFNLEFKQYMNEEEDNIQDIDEKLLKDKNILLVEDNEINRMITKEILKELGLNVICATNGEEAIGMFCKSEVNYYSYILMDIKMPIIDGYKAAKMIRSLKREDSKSIKIIAMSANDFKEDKEEAINSGMDWYISKPISREGIIKALL